MQYGPIFGATAVILTGLTTNLFLIGGTRVLEGLRRCCQHSQHPWVHRDGDDQR